MLRTCRRRVLDGLRQISFYRCTVPSISRLTKFATLLVMIVEARRDQKIFGTFGHHAWNERSAKYSESPLIFGSIKCGGAQDRHEHTGHFLRINVSSSDLQRSTWQTTIEWTFDHNATRVSTSLTRMRFGSKRPFHLSTCLPMCWGLHVGPKAGLC